jgi:hypothetical protein
LEPHDVPSSNGLRQGGGSGLGWLAVGVGLFGWFLAKDPPSSRHVSVDWWETRLYEAAVFGAVAAVAVGLGLRAARSGRPRWVGWAAVVVGGALVVRCIVQIGRWL